MTDKRTTGDAYDDPLQYLNPVARLLTGWSVVLQFETNVPRFAKWVDKSGPHATALFASGRTFRLYGILVGFLAVFINAFGVTMISYPLFVLVGICGMCELACVAVSRKPQREYRRARKMRQDEARASPAPAEEKHVGDRLDRP